MHVTCGKCNALLRTTEDHKITHVFCVCTDVVRRLRIIGAFRQPLLYRVAVGRCMVVDAALETDKQTTSLLHKV